MERGTIVKISSSGIRGIVINTDKYLVELLLYDFSTTWQSIDDLEVIGHSDAIYKAMYEMMQ